MAIGSPSFSSPNLSQDSSADIRYATLQADLTSTALDNQNMLDKRSLTTYESVQHNCGLYACSFLSCKILKKNITTALIKSRKK
ncbi:hypothetical protein MEC_00097 [Bartonella alsatica IBS 382]|uniref:Uncharacterized protein n=1 Tax=Bartonella alsatica IBS 382 TaxID=1094551 RepID=J0YMZ8_9HYPH|nr:hypothetical protein MEC_00097 [Bartonella alsatica IBS 382]